MQKLFISFFFLLVATSIVFSEKWFVCLGSFKIEENAKNYVQFLKEKGYEADIDKKVISGELYNRVLLKLAFDDIDIARSKRDAMLGLKAAAMLKLKDLWLCTSSDEFYSRYQENANDSVEHHFLEKAIKLKQNDDEIPVSNEIPYSIFINKYKEELQANNDRDRLKKKDLDAYVVKTYDDEDLFSFNLHSGSFKNEDEARKIQEKLEKMGISQTKIVEYDDFAEAIKKYDEIVQGKEVKFFDGKYEIPSSFSKSLATCIREFPINKDFQIESIDIFDVNNIRNFSNSAQNTKNRYEDIKINLLNEEKTHAVSIARYKDDLFDKHVDILMQVADKGAYSLQGDWGTKTIKLKAASNVLDCVIKNEEDSIVLQGVNTDGNLFVRMKSKDFTEEEFNLFLNNIANDSSLLAYPQIRKTLLVLPKKNSKTERTFLSFSLNKVDESYAKAKNEALWAQQMVGHWLSKGFFVIDSSEIYVLFFDLDYDYNATQNQKIYEEYHANSIIFDYNRPIDLKYIKGWFFKDEVSFAVKSYSNAVGSKDYCPLEILVDMTNDLQIWE